MGQIQSAEEVLYRNMRNHVKDDTDLARVATMEEFLQSEFGTIDMPWVVAAMEEYASQFTGEEADALQRYRKAIDDLYNESDSVREAVIKHFGLHHSSIALNGGEEASKPQQPIIEMDKAVRCLAVELPEAVHKDISTKWEAVKTLLSAQPTVLKEEASKSEGEAESAPNG